MKTASTPLRVVGGESNHQPLVDCFGRIHTDLRLSVTDRCNLRCFYCMPNESILFRKREELLSFEELARFVGALAPIGITDLRLTGGEPLVRANLHNLVSMLSAIPGISDIALTTNGILLEQQADNLRAAGLRRINISIDALHEEKFFQISRRRGLDRVLAGIAAAQRAGFEQIKLNAVAIRGISEEEIIPLVEFARARCLEIRFIEYMPLDAAGCWDQGDVLSGNELRQRLEHYYGPLVEAPRADASQPAVDFLFSDGRGGVGFINPVTEPFCDTCNRLRLTADGKVRNCLFSTVEWDARRLLRGDSTDDDLRRLVRDCVTAKAAAHGIGAEGFIRPERAMYQIGG